jgi:hypothetical protein
MYYKRGQVVRIQRAEPNKFIYESFVILMEDGVQIIHRHIQDRILRINIPGQMQVLKQKQLIRIIWNNQRDG